MSFGPYTLRTKNIRHFVDFEVRAVELSSEVGYGVVLVCLCEQVYFSLLKLMSFRNLTALILLTTTCSPGGLTMEYQSIQPHSSECCTMSENTDFLIFPSLCTVGECRQICTLGFMT